MAGLAERGSRRSEVDLSSVSKAAWPLASRCPELWGCCGASTARQSAAGCGGNSGNQPATKHKSQLRMMMAVMIAAVRKERETWCIYALRIPGSTHVAAECFQSRRLIRLCPQQARRRDPETGRYAAGFEGSSRISGPGPGTLVFATTVDSRLLRVPHTRTVKAKGSLLDLSCFVVLQFTGGEHHLRTTSVSSKRSVYKDIRRPDHVYTVNSQH